MNCRARKTPHPKQNAMPRNPIPWPLVPGRTAFAIPPSPRTQKTVVPTSSATHTCPSLYDPIFFSFFCSYELLSRLRVMRFLHRFKKLQSSTKLYFQQRNMFYTSSGPWCVCAATCVQNKFWLSKKADDQGGAATGFKDRLLAIRSLLSQQSGEGDEESGEKDLVVPRGFNIAASGHF